MSFRILDTRRQLISTEVSTPQPLPPKPWTELLDEYGSGEIIKVPPGIYTGDFIVKGGCTLKGDGAVTIHGTIILTNAHLIGLTVTNVNIEGTCKVSDSTIGTLRIGSNSISGYLKCNDTTIAKVISMNSNSLFGRCTIGSPANITESIHTTNGMCNIETSSIYGTCYIGHLSVLDCKQTSIIGEECLFITEDDTVTLQIFNCNVTGNRIIKNGPGTSIRFNVSALGSATVFEGGENIKMETI